MRAGGGAEVRTSVKNDLLGCERDLCAWQKRPTDGKETYVHGKRDLLTGKRPLCTAKETYKPLRTRGMRMCQKRPTYFSKETCNMAKGTY